MTDQMRKVAHKTSWSYSRYPLQTKELNNKVMEKVSLVEETTKQHMFRGSSCTHKCRLILKKHALNSVCYLGVTTKHL